jgi:autotransporter passenger strand-loop-strand repeat protein
VQSGGTAVNTTVSSGGMLFVLPDATVLGAAVKRGGLEVLFSGGLLGSGTSATTVSSGGTFEAIGLDASHLPINVLAGATLELGSGATLSSFTVSKGVTVEVLSGGSTTSTVSVGNSGTLELLGGSTAS